MRKRSSSRGEAPAPNPSPSPTPTRPPSSSPIKSKRVAKRGRKTAAGSDDSVVFGYNGVAETASEPPPPPEQHGVEGSHPDQHRGGTDPETAGPEEEEEDDGRHQEDEQPRSSKGKSVRSASSPPSAGEAEQPASPPPTHNMRRSSSSRGEAPATNPSPSPTPTRPPSSSPIKSKRGRKTAALGSEEDSLVLGRDGVAVQQPQIQEQGSQSDQHRGREQGGTAGPEEKDDGQDGQPQSKGNSLDSTAPSVREVEVEQPAAPADKMSKSSNDALAPNPLPNNKKKKRATKSHQPEVQEAQGEEGPQAYKRRSKKIRPESAHQQPAAGSVDSVVLGHNGVAEIANPPPEHSEQHRGTSPEEEQEKEKDDDRQADEQPQSKGNSVHTTSPSAREAEQPQSKGNSVATSPSAREVEQPQSKGTSSHKSGDKSPPTHNMRKRSSSSNNDKSHQPEVPTMGQEVPAPNPHRNKKKKKKRATHQPEAPTPDLEAQGEAPAPTHSTRKRSSSSSDVPAQRNNKSHQPEVQEEQGEGPQINKHTSKKIRPESAHQQGDPGVQLIGKSEKARRVWNDHDEILILKEINKFLLEHQRLPDVKDNAFFQSVLEQLQDGTCDLRNVKDKMKSLKRRYDGHVTSTTVHERRLDKLSEKVWGPRSSNTAVTGSKDKDKQAEGEPSLAGGAEKSFQEMYPLLTREVMLIADQQPSAKSLCVGLDADTALSIEKKLDKIKGTELKIQMRMEAKVIAPKAIIKKKLVGLLEKVSKKVQR